MVWLPVLVPALGGVAVLALRRRRRWLGPAAGAATTLTVVVGVWVALTEATGAWTWGAGMDLGLAATGLSRLMVVLVPTIATAVAVYAASHLHEDPALARLLAMIVWFVAAMELLVLAADFLTLLVAWELVGAASWTLIGHEWRDAERPRSAREAFVTTRFGDLGLYVASGAVFALTGGFFFSGLEGADDPVLLGVVAGGVLLAAAAKSAQFPFSPWLFSAMAGPTPVSALLHSATMVAAGAYLLARLQPLLEPVPWFSPAVIGIGLVTALAGGVVALTQSDFKRALAGSTSAQYGLMLVAIGAGFTGAAAGQLTAHAAFKSLLFLGAGVALHAGGTLDLSKLRLGRALPRVAALFGVGALALAAVPPLGGAFTKETILAAAFHSGVWVGAGVAVAGFLSALYAGRLHLLAYGPGDRELRDGPPRRAEVGAMAFLAILSVGLGLLWLPGGDRMIERVSGGLVAEGSAWELVLSLGLLVVAFGLLGVWWRRGSLVSMGLADGLRRFVAEWWGLPTAARAAVVEPVVGTSRGLAWFDRRTLDRLVQALAGFFRRLSSGLRRVVEPVVDGFVRMVAGGTVASAEVSRRVDDDGVDAAVEGVAEGVGAAGARSRRLQSGMSHHYYTMLVIGTVVAIVVAALWR